MPKKKIKRRDPIKRPSARPDAVKDLDAGISLKARFWLEKGDHTFLAAGRIDLLKQIEKTGSISAAAEAMGISYHHAWTMIDRMNELSPEPLISASTGGKGGGGTALTPTGKKILSRFDQIQTLFQELIAEINVSFED
ncbi:MAG: winged helix-turn-helix domain-containing protein [Vampirovibrionia bacterium]